MQTVGKSARFRRKRIEIITEDIAECKAKTLLRQSKFFYQIKSLQMLFKLLLSNILLSKVITYMYKNIIDLCAGN